MSTIPSSASAMPSGFTFPLNPLAQSNPTSDASSDNIAGIPTSETTDSRLADNCGDAPFIEKPAPHARHIENRIPMHPKADEPAPQDDNRIMLLPKAQVVLQRTRKETQSGVPKKAPSKA